MMHPRIDRMAKRQACGSIPRRSREIAQQVRRAEERRLLNR